MAFLNWCFVGHKYGQKFGNLRQCVLLAGGKCFGFCGECGPAGAFVLNQWRLESGVGVWYVLHKGER